MKGYNRLVVIFCVIAAAMFAAVNFALPGLSDDAAGMRNVEIGRVVREITDTGAIPDVSGYETILGVYEQTDSDDFFVSRSDYVIRQINGKLYRIEYAETSDNRGVLYINAALAVFTVAVIVLLLYIRHSIIKPFAEISEMPYELAKGNLTVPLKENKNRYFGKFLWGLDMLREKLERSKQAELELQKEKKTMLMSLSHDIKTPLSAIKLYSAALSKGIYTDAGKQTEAAVSINEKADEIEQLVSEIMHANSEDILRFDVTPGEFYLSSVIDRIASYYRDRLSGSVFGIGGYTDCMINGDADRLVEVLQNIIENAIKYGDGRSISLSFSDEEDCRLITVRNSGCTLSESETAHVFDSFWRGSNVGSNSGSGLGLYICRQLMSAMNGDIFAETDAGDMCVTVVCSKTSGQERMPLSASPADDES